MKISKVLWQIHDWRNCEMKYIEYVYGCGIYHACVVCVCVYIKHKKEALAWSLAGMSRHHRSLVKNWSYLTFFPLFLCWYFTFEKINEVSIHLYFLSFFLSLFLSFGVHVKFIYNIHLFRIGLKDTNHMPMIVRFFSFFFSILYINLQYAYRIP